MDESYADIREEDRQVLATLVQAGANLSERRSVRHYLYLPDERSARECELELSGTGWNVDVREPLAGSDEWSVVCDQGDYVLLPEVVAEDRALFERLADSHVGTYDGWEASV